jgi:hypothetical protein
VANNYLLMIVQFFESILCSTQQQSKQNAQQNFVHNNINYWCPRAQCSGKYWRETVRAESATKSSTLAKHDNTSVNALCRPKICCHYRCLPLSGRKNMSRSQSSCTTGTLFLHKCLMYV